MDPNLQHLRFQFYSIFVGVNGILVQTIAQVVESTQENKIRVGISLASLGMNVVIARWVFSTGRDIRGYNKWKVFVLNITGIMSPYLAFSMLIPEWFTWYGFAIICIILTIIETHQKLQMMFIWSYEKCVDAIKMLIWSYDKCVDGIKYLGRKFSELI